MDMEIDQPQPFYDFNEGDGFNFDFEPDYQASVDPYAVKQEVYSPSETDGTFSSPSVSPVPALPPADSMVFSTMPIDISSHSDENLFEDPIATEPVPFDAVAQAEDSSRPSAAHQDSSYGESSDSEGQTKRGRKRKAATSSTGERKKMRFEPGYVIPKDQLHSLTSEELEEYAQHIQDSSMTAAEKNEIRKQLRLVKNRESAQASRLRKKNYIDDLERRVSQLQQENTNLRSNISNLHTENTQLKSEVVYLKGVVNNSGLSKVLSQGASFFSKLSQQQQADQAQASPGAKQTALNPRTAGVVLMVVLLSVGLMFNGPAGQQALPGKSLTTEQKQGRILSHANYKPTSEVRHVLNVLEQSEMPTQRIRQMVEKQREMPSSASHKVLEDAPKSLGAASIAEERPTVVQDWKANTTYLLCPDVQKLNPPQSIKEAQDPSLPQQISFLIPSTALDAGDAAPLSRSNSMLEVTCQVLDVVARPSSTSRSSDVVV